MKIATVRIRNLRSFKDVTIPLNDYTCLVGPNGAGKSTVLCALNILFRESSHSTIDLTHLCDEDFHHKDTKESVEVIVTFKDLSEDAQKDFADYYRQGQLVVSAVASFNEATGKADVKQFGQRLGMAAFKDFFKAEGDGAKVSDLKDLYIKAKEIFPDLPDAKTKEPMRDALRTYEADRPEQCELITSEDQFYGVSKGANRLAKYVQWVYVPAVKDVTSEQMEARNTTLGKLLARTVRSKTDFSDSIRLLRDETRSKYQGLLDERQQVLAEISASLQTRLTEWSHPEAKLKLEWQQDPDKSVSVQEPWAGIIAGEGNFEGALARFGHGLQRSYLLALLHELAASDDSNAPTLILGCEEPELYQHPPQARHLATVLQKLSLGNSQIIVSTHSPLFVSGDGFEDVRMVRKDLKNKCSYVEFSTYANIAQTLAQARGEQRAKPQGTLAKIHQALQPTLNEMFFTSRLILVEGVEDVAYITTYLHLLRKWDDYRRLGCHIVPVNGKSELLQSLVIAKALGIWTYVVFDSDADKPDRNGSRTRHEADNKALLNILQSTEAAFPTDTVWTNNFVMWNSDITTIIDNEVGTNEWAQFQQEADKLYDHAGGLRKNSLHIGTSLSMAWDAGKCSPSLERLCDVILAPEEASVAVEAVVA